ncbi:LOW QUALITY PROTEIN: uncharacterized protein ACB057_017788 [Neosynchiropus ocellatus]
MIHFSTDSIPSTAAADLVKRSVTCPENWHESNGRCFLYNTAQLSWAQAELHCQTIGGNLASIHDHKNAELILGLMTQVGHAHHVAWAGGTNAQELEHEDLGSVRITVRHCGLVSSIWSSKKFCFSIAEKMPQVNSCPQPWSFYNGRCFYVERRQMNWTQAQDNCQSMGGNLTSIENITEYQNIQMLIRNGTNDLPLSWVGGTAGENVSIWRWIDGRELTYSDWCPGEPNKPDQQCLQINYSHQRCWDNDHCEFLKVSVCHAPATYVSSATLNRCVLHFNVLLSLFAIFLSDML